MAIVVSDNFTRADDPASLGIATTGQVWANVPGEGHIGIGAPFGILGNQGWWNRDGSGVPGDGLAVLETELADPKVSVAIVDPTAGGTSNLRNQGVVARYVDATHYMFLTFYGANEGGIGSGFRLYVADGGATTHVGPDCYFTLSPGDIITLALCGQVAVAYINGVVATNYPITFFPPLSPTLLAGTKCGLQANGGVISSPPFQLFDNFLVETNGTCTPTYNCTESGCVDPGDGSGTYATLDACLTACMIPESYNCVDGTCVDPGDGSGTFPTLLECQLSGCSGVHTAETEVFDAGEGSAYWLVPHLTDSGEELRTKNAKSIYLVGRLTNCSAMGYAYDVEQPINVPDLEDGVRTNSRNITRPQTFEDTTEVTQTKRKPINITGTTTTCRVEGDDTGNTERDRIDQICMEVAVKGVRR